MKIIVDELPYYGDICVFDKFCSCADDTKECPRFWSKYKIANEYNETNPHECELLKEMKQEDY